MLMHGAVFGCLISQVTDLILFHHFLYFCQFEMFEILPVPVLALIWSISRLRYLCCRLFLPDGACLSTDWRLAFYPTGALTDLNGRLQFTKAVTVFCNISAFLIDSGLAYKASQFCWWRSAVMAILACSVLVNITIILCFTGVTSHHTYYIIIHFCMLQTVTNIFRSFSQN